MTSSLRPGASAVCSSRGFIENSIGVLFNGVQVQSSTITMRNYDAFNFDRVAIVRGPASVIFGEGLAAGAVNFVRREARPGRAQIGQQAGRRMAEQPTSARSFLHRKVASERAATDRSGQGTRPFHESRRSCRSPATNAPMFAAPRRRRSRRTTFGESAS